MLEPLIIHESEDTPEVVFNKSNKKFEITGRSYPENAFEFYLPVLEWLDNYIQEPNDSTNLIFRFDYFNSSSAKQIVEIIKKIINLNKQGNIAKIEWLYNKSDISMKNKGLEIQRKIYFPFILKPV